MDTQTTIRPTKKQREILTFIEEFIAEHGYSPSYREIVTGTDHNSVATVAVHINNLIKRGHLTKRDNSARSLEVTSTSQDAGSKVFVKQLNETQTKWLVDKVDAFFKEAELSTHLSNEQIDKLYVLLGALKVLGLEGAASSFMPRLSQLKNNMEKSKGGLYA